MGSLKAITGITANRRTSPINPNVQILTFDVKNGQNSTVHTLTNVPAGAVLVITTQCETFGNNCTVSSSPALPWTKRADSTGNQSGDAEIWAVQFPAGGSITVTSDWPGQYQSSTCYVVINADPTFSGASATVASQALPSLAISTTAADSLLICVTSDWNAVDGVNRLYRGTPIVETQYFRQLNFTTGYHYYKIASAISSYTLGLTAPGMANGGGTCILELRTAGPPDLQAPTAPVLSLGTIVSTTIDLNWTAATDNIAVVGYDVYVNNSFNGTTTNLTYTVQNLASSTLYSIFVKSRDAAGNTTNSNTVSATTNPPDNSNGTLVYQTGYNTNADLDPFGHGQIGNGSLSTTVFHTGPGSFKSVPANVSSGIRSEVQYDEGGLGQGQTPLEGVVEYWVMYEVAFHDSGHSLQWHPSTSGGSAAPGLWHQGGQWSWVNWKGGVNTFHDTNHTIQTNHWYFIRIEYKFGSAGYFRFYIDGVLNPGGSWTGQVGDGSTPYLKVGVNQWVNQTSIVYYDDLKIWQKP